MSKTTAAIALIPFEWPRKSSIEEKNKKRRNHHPRRRACAWIDTVRDTSAQLVPLITAPRAIKLLQYIKPVDPRSLRFYVTYIRKIPYLTRKILLFDTVPKGVNIIKIPSRQRKNEIRTFLRVSFHRYGTFVPALTRPLKLEYISMLKRERDAKYARQLKLSAFNESIIYKKVSNFRCGLNPRYYTSSRPSNCTYASR